jgi:hypothetical protein
MTARSKIGRRDYVIQRAKAVLLHSLPYADPGRQEWLTGIIAQALRSSALAVRSAGV